jgi:hypothetical protein
VSVRDWIDLTRREAEPFGSASAGLVWRPKDVVWPAGRVDVRGQPF